MDAGADAVEDLGLKDATNARNFARPVNFDDAQVREGVTYARSER